MAAVRPCGDFKVSYAADMALLDTAFYRAGFAVLLAALAAAPLLLGRYIFLMNIIGIFAIGATGLVILTGFTGQISLGHAAFMAVGAYASAFTSERFGLPFPVALVLASLVAFLFGAAVGLPSLRIKGLYLAIATLAFQFLIEYIIIHATGGTGAILVPPAGVGRFVVETEVQFYYLLLVLWLGSGIFAANVLRSRYGLAFMAVRDRDYAAEVLGINLLRYKVLSFGLAAFYAGLAGSLWAHYNKLITPEHFTILTSIDYIAMIVIGGMGSIWGPHLGSAFVVFLSQGLKILTPLLIKVLPVFGKIAVPAREVLFGMVIIGLLIWEPGGLAMLLRKLKRYLDLWPFAY